MSRGPINTKLYAYRLTILDGSESEWMKDALCALPGNREIFWEAEKIFSVPGRFGKKRVLRLTASVCAECPVIFDCAIFASQIHPTIGVWAGKPYGDKVRRR